MLLLAILEDSSRGFLISVLAEIGVPLGGRHGVPKITKTLFSNFEFYGSNHLFEMFFDEKRAKKTMFGCFSRF